MQLLASNISTVPTVLKYGLGIHEDIQSNLHDAPHRPLVRMPPVSGANAARIPQQIVGCNQ